MLRRRILASAMASVMAIGSVAVVASAEDTAAATKQVKTKADLEALVKSYDSFRAKEINDYGSMSGEKFLDALEYADNVINDSASTVDDYTVAYQMVTATYNSLKIYTTEELATLIKANKSKYDSKNILNDELNDNLYDGDKWDKFVSEYESAEDVLDSKDSRIISDAYESLTDAAANLGGLTVVTKAQFRTALKNYETQKLNDNLYDGDKWDKFVSEYESAEDVLDSKDSRIISDAYESLTDAAANLGGLTVVTKAQFRTALKNYETQKQNIYRYDTWRRGTVSGDLGGVDDSWKFSVNTSYGALYSVITNDETDFYNMYDELDSYKNVSKTSKEDIVKAYKKASSYATILGAWAPDDTARASKATVKSLIDKYRGVLVFNYDRDDAYALLDQIAAKTTLGYDKDKSADEPWTLEVAEKVSVDDYSNQWHNSGSVTKLTEAHINVKNTNVAVYIPTKDNLWTGDPILAAGDDYKTNKISGVSYKLFSKGSTIDLTDYINVTAADVNAHKNDAYAPAVAVKAEKTTAGDEARTAVAAANKAIAANDANATNVAAVDTAVAAKDAKIQEAWKTFKTGYLAAYANLKTAIKAVENALNASSTAKTATQASSDADAILAAGDDLKAAIAAMNEYFGENGVNGAALATYGNAISWDSTLIPWDATGAAKEVVKAAQPIVDSVADIKKEAYPRDAFVEEQYTKYGLSNNTENEGTDSYGDKIGEWIFKDYVQLTTDAIQTTKGKTAQIKHVDLATALELAELYIEGDKTKLADAAQNDIYNLCDTTGEFVEGSAKGSAAEWTVVYRYLSYALSDKYDLVAAKYTKAQVADLLEKSYDLAEKTGDAGLFAAHHDTLVDVRKEASEWIAAANKEKKYKDNVSAPNGVLATSMYEKLKNAYDALEKDYNAFKYSFGEIYVALSTYAEMIDEGELVANDTLKTAMEQTALKLSTVESLDDALYKDGWEANTDVDWTIDNDAYTSDRFFNDYNRVFTSNDNYELATKTKAGKAKIHKPDDSSAAKSHKELKEAYEALLAEVTKQTTPTTVLGDVNGDGVVNALDAAAILKAVVNNTAIDVAVGDYNADGAVNALDAAAILKFVVSKA